MRNSAKALSSTWAAKQTQARLILLGAAFLGALYYGSWEISRWSEGPGFILLLGSMPWSLPWLELSVNAKLPGPIYKVISEFVVCMGFGLNCAFLYFIFAWLITLLRITRRSSATSLPSAETRLS